MKDLLPNSCRAGKHNFENVYTREDKEESILFVKWCKDCGALRIEYKEKGIPTPRFKTHLISLFNQIALIKVK
jgi:hypothetical protein